MGMAKGGWSKIEFDDAANFATPTEITGLLKDGTSFEPDTDTEELADGSAGSAGKKVKGTITSKDINQTALTELVAAEEALTQLWMRFYHMKGTGDYYTLKKVRIWVDHMPKPTGKFHAVRITLSGYAVTQADLIALTQS